MEAQLEPPVGSPALTAKRVVVVARDSLIVEALQLALKHSAVLQPVGDFDHRSLSVAGVCALAPDLVLVDDMEHSAQALASIAALKAADPRLWVILLTVRDDVDWLEAVLDAGADAAISKAISPSSLVTILEEAATGKLLHARPQRRASRHQGHPSGTGNLTSRELEILDLVSGGQTNAQIAADLFVAEQTIKFHVANILRKLGVANRTQASHYAHVHGLVGR